MQSLTIHIDPLGINLQVAPGSNLLAILRAQGIWLEAPCGGVGLCRKCIVLEDGHELLACQTTVERSMHIRLPQPPPSVVLQPPHSPQRLSRHSPVQIEHLQSKQPGSIYENLVAHHPHLPWVLLNGVLPGRTNGWGWLVSYHTHPIIVSASRPTHIYGLAVDIGTTTLQACLVDLQQGTEKGRASLLNPLVYYGHDVLSRVAYLTKHPQETLNFQGTLLQSITQLAESLCKREEIGLKHLYAVCLAGNTIMTHLALGLDVRQIGQAPYTPCLLSGGICEARDLGLPFQPRAIVNILPAISSFVGGDIIAGLLTLKAPPEPFLFIDIGTNGEMLLGADGRFWATSTAAGPAFEGHNICCGMRAGPGAIAHVHLQDDLEYEVIGHTAARGLCGSGLIELVALLLQTGLITPDGRLVEPTAQIPPALASRWQIRNNKRYFDIQVQPPIFLSQGDIRQVQLAKGAIRTGIELLCQSAHIPVAHIAAVYFAGAFGSHIDATKLVTIGLLPPELAAKTQCRGNTALAGTRDLLLGQATSEQAHQLVAQTTEISLAEHPQFEEVFVHSLNFPDRV